MFNGQLKCLACLVNCILYLLYWESAHRGPTDLQDAVPRVDGIEVVGTDVHPGALFRVHGGGILRRDTFLGHGEAASALGGGRRGDERDGVGQLVLDRHRRQPFKHRCRHHLIMPLPTITECSMLHHGVCIPILNDHLVLCDSCMLDGVETPQSPGKSCNHQGALTAELPKLGPSVLVAVECPILLIVPVGEGFLAFEPLKGSLEMK